MSSNRLNRSWLKKTMSVIVLLVAGIIIGFAAASARQGSRTILASSTPNPSKPSPSLAASIGPLATLQNGFTAISQQVMPSVVFIRMSKTINTPKELQFPSDLFRDFPGFHGFGDQDSPFLSTPPTVRVRGSGSGVIIRSDGWILTNDHVVGGADKVTVRLYDGRELDGMVRRDYRSDLALVKINATGLVPAELDDSSKVQVGEIVLAFGSPFGLEDTVTHGMISARAREQEAGEQGEVRAYSNLLQTDAAINPGNSGGPLVDVNGKIIGINVAIESPSGGNVGIGFAIPSNTARYVMDQLITKGKVTRGFLGVAPRPLNYDEKQRLGISKGAVVEAVTDDTPAARAGLQPGDVIVRIERQLVSDDNALRDIVARMHPGTRISLEIRRGDRDMTLSAILVEAPNMPTSEPNSPAGPAGGKLGIRVETLNSAMAQQHNITGVAHGALIVQVQAGSPAQDAGLQPGDVIIRANGKAVERADDLSALERAKSGESVDLVIYRNKSRIFVDVNVR